MPEYDNTNTGVLWKNDQKGNDRAPWYKGKAVIGLDDYEVAAWVRESKKDGSKFLSLKFTLKEQDPGLNRREDQPIEESDDIPF